MTRARKLFLLMRMSVWLLLFSAAALLLPMPRALRWTEPRRRRAPGFSPHEIAAVLDRLRPSCWKRAAVLRRYLLLGGIETEVVFGVRKDLGDLEGHAWLERDGAPFLEATAPRHTVTFRYP